MRPVSTAYPTNQPFGSMKTQGVAPSSTPNTVGWYVKQYGNYQPYGHAGCDIACPTGTPVHAIASGKVLWADWGTNLPGDESNAGYRRRWYLYKSFPGIVTVIQHPGWIGVYAHLSFAQMSIGDTVTEGQQIGLSGGTGGVAPHLHVEALVDLNYPTGGGLIYGRTDPEPYFGGIAAMGNTATPIEQDWSDMATKQEVTEALMDALNWAIDTDDGKKLSVFGMVGAVVPMLTKMPDRILDAETDRHGEFGGKTSLRGHLAYADQKHIEDLRSSAMAAHGDGVSADQIIQAVRDALKEGVKVQANITVGE